jgi:hypothetical protein
MALEYINLDLYLRVSGDELIVEARGPDGEWAQTYTPLADLQLEDLELHYLKPRVILANISSDEIHKVGYLLGNVLLSGDVKELYSDLFKKIVIGSGICLRLLLHFVGNAQRIAFLPWEAVMYENQPILSDPRQSIARTVDLADPIPSLAESPSTYRILWLISQPIDYVEMNLEEEARDVRKTLDRLVQKGLVEFQVRENLTPLQLENELRNGNYHTFYFSGVSSYDNTGKAFLLLVDENKKSSMVSAQKFTTMLRGTNIDIIFFNSGDGMIGRNEFGIAEAAMQSGVPIVISHNFMALTTEGSVLARAFFESVVKTNSVDRALFEARRQLAQTKTLETTWPNVILYYRTIDSQFWSGESGYMIETFIRDGELVSEAKRTDKFNANQFAERIENANEGIKKILAEGDQAKARALIAKANDAITNQDANLAGNYLSEASEFIVTTIRNQERIQEKQQREAWSRWTVLAIAALLMFTVIGLAYFLRDDWIPEMTIPVIGIPVSVIVWSFIGGVAAILQEFVATRRSAEPPTVDYEWLLWRPVVGVVMGSSLYLAIRGGLLVLGQGGEVTSSYILWLLAFIGGFSDKFAELVYDMVVRRFTNKNGDNKKSEPSDDAKASTLGEVSQSKENEEEK